MKKLFVIIAAVVMVTGFTTKVKAQATENTAAAARIVTPISITETSSLHFGTMAISAGAPGTCVLSTQGARTQTGGVNLSVPTWQSSCWEWNPRAVPGRHQQVPCRECLSPARVL